MTTAYIERALTIRDQQDSDDLRSLLITIQLSSAETVAATVGRFSAAKRDGKWWVSEAAR